MTSVAQMFSERFSFWISQGHSGAEVYSMLATDTELPVFFEEPDVAAICGLSTHAITARRKKGNDPKFIRLSRRSVRYPRAEFCEWLAKLSAPNAV